MLLNNGTLFSARLISGTNVTNLLSSYTICNAKAFGQTTSIPQGYPNPQVALVPTLKTSGQIGSRQQVDVSLTANLFGIGNVSSAPSFDVDLTGSANVLLNGYSTLNVDIDLTSSIRATGNLSSNIDWVARPSAFDIAQEIWNSAATSYNIAGTMGRKLNDAAAGGGGGGSGETIIRADETAQGGDFYSIRLNSAASTTDHIYIGTKVLIVSGTGAEQMRPIKFYYGTNRRAEVEYAWHVAPDNTSVYRILA